MKLDAERINTLVEAAVDSGLADSGRRDLLLAGLPKAAIARLPNKERPADQLRSDLNELAGMGSLGGLDRQPIEVWLNNAAEVLGGDSRADVFREALDLVRGQGGDGRAVSHTNGRPPTGDDSWEAELLGGVDAGVANRVRGLLAFYVGTPTSPAPFVGRDAEIEKLLGFAAGSGEPNLLVVEAPTGRGKSALLCHMLRALDGDIAVAFYPFSARYRTADANLALDALLSRLAWIRREPRQRVTSSAEKSAAVSDLLRRPLPGEARLLVVLDGLDEASSLEDITALIPRVLPPTTRVVLSVRSSAHLDGSRLLSRLAWSKADALILDLSTLRRDAVEQLAQARVPHLAADPKNLRLLFQQCGEGDPLLLRLLLEEWVDGAPSDGGPSDAGLEGLWKRQVRRAEEDAMVEGGPAWSVVAALASAAGPLARSDFLDLLKDQVPNGPALDRALKVVGRFVMEPESGFYVFCHPRLQQYVLESLLSGAQRADWQARLARWGIGVVRTATDAGTDMAPAYVAAHLAEHLGAVTGLDGLTSEWLDGWHLLLEPVWFEVRRPNGGLPGYLTDLDRLRNALETGDRRLISRGELPKNVAALVRCALCRSSASRSAHTPVRLLAHALELGVLAAAEVLTRLQVRDRSSSLDPTEADWARLVASLPVETLADAVDVGVSDARLEGRSGDIDFLRALMARLSEWHERVGFAWLEDVKRASDRVRLIVSGWRANAEIPDLRSRLGSMLQREVDTVRPRRVLASVLDELVEALGSAAVAVLAEEICDEVADAQEQAQWLVTNIAVVRYMAEPARTSWLRRALRGAETNGVQALDAALHQLVEHAPDLIPTAFEVVDADMLTRVAVGFWPDPNIRSHVFALRGAIVNSADGRADRCAVLRGALSPDALATARETAMERALAAVERDVGLMRGVAVDLTQEQADELLNRVTDPELQGVARRALVGQVSPTEQATALRDAVLSGRRDHVSMVVDVMLKATEVDIESVRSVAREAQDPYVALLLALLQASRASGSDRVPHLRAATEALSGALQAQVIAPATALRLFAVMVRLQPSEIGLRIIRDLLAARPRDIDTAWVQLRALLEVVRGSWRADLFDSMSNAVMSRDGGVMNLSRGFVDKLDPDSLRRWLVRVRARVRHDRARLIFQTMHALELGVSGVDYADWVREAIDVTSVHSDARERLSCLVGLAPERDHGIGLLTALWEREPLTERLGIARSIPQGYLAGSPDRVRAWMRDELEHLLSVDLDRVTVPVGVRLLISLGTDEERLQAEQHVRKLLCAFDRPAFGTPSVREAMPDDWRAVVEDSENPNRRVVRCFLGAVDLCRPFFTREELVHYSRRVPLLEVGLLSLCLESMPGPERNQLADEARRHSQYLGPPARGDVMSRLAQHLAEPQQGAAVDGALAAIGAQQSTVRHRGDVLHRLAPLFESRHLERVVVEARRTWVSIALGLAEFVQRLDSQFRRVFIPAFVAQLSDKETERRTYPVSTAALNITGGGDDATASQRRLLMPYLVACDDGPVPGEVDWSRAASTLQPPSQWVMERLAEKLSAGQLADYIQSWASDPHRNPISRPLGVLVPALVGRAGGASDADKVELYQLVVAELYRDLDGRAGLLRALVDLAPALTVFAGEPMGPVIASAVEEAGQRWP